MFNRRSFLTTGIAAAAASLGAKALGADSGLTAAQEKHDVRNLRITDLRTFLVDAGNDENYV
ncbi:MAG: hypothetical protein KDK74_03280, partial [Cephaloticoccus sp.]|nr:hypothetical protein [Cephaloticoccus sp.]